VITAVLVLQCRDEGLLDLDDPIGRHVPETGYAASTVRSLLAHVSGMQSEPVGPWWERSPGASVEDLIRANDGSGAVFGPGEHWHYSNLGFALLGEAAARLRGRPWSQLVQERVLAPLGMTRTSYLPEEPFARGLSVHHLANTLTPEPLHDTGAMAPAGQLWSTTEDLAKLAAFLSFGNPRVLADQTLIEMRQPVAPAIDYGLGVRLLPYADGVLSGHTGSMPGYQATLFADPLAHVGVVAVTNATTGFSGSELALALLADHTPTPVAPWRPAESVPGWARELLGYWHWGNTAFEVRWQGDLLEFRDLSVGGVVDQQFGRRDDRIVGVAGYHHGETLHVVRAEDGSVEHLECATFVYTREPYPEGP
jgi:CubicO group peptidase (beta-lactamase class C family)